MKRVGEKPKLKCVMCKLRYGNQKIAWKKLKKADKRTKREDQIEKTEKSYSKDVWRRR